MVYATSKPVLIRSDKVIHVSRIFSEHRTYTQSDRTPSVVSRCFLRRTAVIWLYMSGAVSAVCSPHSLGALASAHPTPQSRVGAVCRQRVQRVRSDQCCMSRDERRARVPDTRDRTGGEYIVIRMRGRPMGRPCVLYTIRPLNCTVYISKLRVFSVYGLALKQRLTDTVRRGTSSLTSAVHRQTCAVSLNHLALTTLFRTLCTPPRGPRTAGTAPGARGGRWCQMACSVRSSAAGALRRAPPCS